jgi:hypothetical protein
MDKQEKISIGMACYGEKREALWLSFPFLFIPRSLSATAIPVIKSFLETKSISDRAR